MRVWLIRTQKNEILGPIGIEKLKDFVRRGALGPDDEVCSGNGYWFYIKEKDLIQKYILDNGLQSFNPVTEAKSVIQFDDKEEGSGPIPKWPSQENLEYPDMQVTEIRKSKKTYE